jgi:hypothetical protein
MREQGNDIKIQLVDDFIGDDEYGWSRVEINHAGT